MEENSDVLLSILQNPGNLALQENLVFATHVGFTQVSLCRQSTGHMVVYGPHGRRILFVDPDGNPLHECEWKQTAHSCVEFLSARVFLDWDQWVGIKPAGLVNAMTLDLSTRPGWESLTPQDLRMMASQAMGVELEEVEFFYRDDDLLIDAFGQVTIQQRKDAFYILKDGTFTQPRFMSCMSAMHWENIDYLPVVELFKSLLPGTGSATFELIRGLYDDQNPTNLKPLQYRGIPTYPSEAAFGLFSNFFTASHSGYENPFSVFMNTSRSHEVTWLPNPSPPIRFVDSLQKACLTVKQRTLQKVTLMKDTSGLAFSTPNQQGFSPCARTLAIHNNELVLEDQANTQYLSVKASWNIDSDQNRHLAPEFSKAPGWQSLFSGGAPLITAKDAFSSVLLYPNDDSMIEEYSSQPFIADFLDDLFEQDKRLAQQRGAAKRILIHGFEASIVTCIVLEPSRQHTIVFAHIPLTQKQAQMLWNQLARTNKLDWLPSFRFIRKEQANYTELYDWLYRWIPFEEYTQELKLQESIQEVTRLLAPSGMAFLAGPGSVPALVNGLPLEILFGEMGSSLQPFSTHQSILPKSKLHPDLHIWCLQKI